MNSNLTLMSRMNTETMRGSYTGVDIMAVNGLSANQNQVMITSKIILTKTINAGLSVTPI